ncbi:unnamed protein product [Lymnaea stagnalis]|uniref:Uncharacterized protein n=1 Tax=Lymnaea stagnalis TaxID=6523 RepID=A0AAV2I558_LYMST
MNEWQREKDSSYNTKLEMWTSKEAQLNLLHEEIINKREALLRSSKNFLHKGSQNELPISNTDAAIRNDKIIKDINSLEKQLNQSLTEPLSPRFANLQANYWSMVNNMFPIWKKSLDEL